MIAFPKLDDAFTFARGYKSSTDKVVILRLKTKKGKPTN
jgi:hypothetical protein